MDRELSILFALMYPFGQNVIALYKKNMPLWKYSFSGFLQLVLSNAIQLLLKIQSTKEHWTPLLSCNGHVMLEQACYINVSRQTSFFQLKYQLCNPSVVLLITLANMTICRTHFSQPMVQREFLYCEYIIHWRKMNLATFNY